MTAYRTPAEKPEEPEVPWYFRSPTSSIIPLIVPFADVWLAVLLDKLCEHASTRVVVGAWFSYALFVIFSGMATFAYLESAERHKS